jgi:class 3 adenylate cyclase
MDDGKTLFAALREVAQPQAAEALEHLVGHAGDADLAHVNALELAAAYGLPEDVMIAALLQASRLGLFEMSWNVLCPSCSGVLDASSTLKSVREGAYHCAFCALSSEPNLDGTVEVAFSVSPRVRRIAAHDPDSLGFWDYYRQIFLGSGVVYPQPDRFDALAEAAVLERVELQAGERMILVLQLPSEPVVVFDPVTHAAQHLDIAGEPTRERQELSLVFGDQRPPVRRASLQPGALRLSLDNRSRNRVLPGVFVEGRELGQLIGNRLPHLTAKRLLSNQTFRDLYRTDTLDVDQRLKILSLTFLFTDLKGSTELYDRVGDLVAYDLVRTHFQILTKIVAAEGGAVVKTIGDAVMATFPTSHAALAAAFRMRDAMRSLNDTSGAEELVLKIGIHEGPCLAVNLNDRQDYFGQTVNIASRVQELATSDAIFVTEPVIQHGQPDGLPGGRQTSSRPMEASLKGVGGRISVYQLS